jgi:hypothetical protein
VRIVGMDVKKIQETTISNLESIIEGVRNIEFVEEVSYSFNTNEIQGERFVESLLTRIQKQIDHARFGYIYTFFLPSNFHMSSVYDNYEAVKNSRKAGRAYARLNKTNRESYCLYVGSSNDLIPRIRQHLGFGPKGTFSMQLCYWCENANLDVTLKIYAFNNSIDTKAFQAFEDGVWDSLRPMLGRQGRK